jgi:hypothetical protein
MGDWSFCPWQLTRSLPEPASDLENEPLKNWSQDPWQRPSVAARGTVTHEATYERADCVFLRSARLDCALESLTLRWLLCFELEWERRAVVILSEGKVSQLLHSFSGDVTDIDSAGRAFYTSVWRRQSSIEWVIHAALHWKGHFPTLC